MCNDVFLIPAIDIQTATRAEKKLKTTFLKPGGPENLGNDRFHRCDSICQIFVQIGAILAIFRPFEVFGLNFFETLNGRLLILIRGGFTN